MSVYGEMPGQMNPTNGAVHTDSVKEEGHCVRHVPKDLKQGIHSFHSATELSCSQQYFKNQLLRRLNT